MKRFTGIRQKLMAVFLTAGMAVSPVAATVNVYAATEENAPAAGQVTGSGVSAPLPDGVTGEAIVCFRQEAEDASKPEASLKSAQEREIEGETFVDSAEALLLVDRPEDTPLPGIITLVQSDHLSTEELIRELEAREDVIYAEPNYIYTPEAEDYTSNQWADNTTYGIGNEGWNTYSEGQPTPKVNTSGQVVAIIDTGVDYTHEDLADVMWSDGENYPELTKLGGGKYGFCGTLVNTDSKPYDSKDPMDDHGHGTHCAGIAAASWNGIGVSGVASGARIMAVKVANNRGIFPTDAVIRGYNYMITAKKAGVNICSANNSYGGTITSQTELLLIEEAGKAGIVCCFSAGNDASNLDNANVSSVIRSDLPEVLVVGASDSEGEMADFSNYGQRDVDVFAPGVKIFSTVIMGKGTPAETTSVFKDGDTTCRVDYSDKTQLWDDEMGLTADEGITASIREGKDGKNVLHLEAEDGVFTLRTKSLSDIESLKGGVIRVYLENKCSGNIFASSVDKEGETLDTIGDGNTSLTRGWNDLGFVTDSFFEYSEEKKDVGVELRFYFSEGKGDDEKNIKEVDLRFIRLTDATENYVAWNGTSMAAPQITGSIAVLAAAFPKDSAEKLAARVTGSVLPMDAMKGKCLSGGIFRLDKALAEETVPVPLSASVEGNRVQVKGFFFGETAGTITAAGQSCTVDSWSDEEITAVLPADLPAGEALLEVTSGKGSGHRFFNLTKPAKTFDSLPLPGIPVSDTGLYVPDAEAKQTYAEFYYGDPVGMTALKDSLYVFFAENEWKTAIYQYQINSKTWKKVYSGGDYFPTGAVCNWNGKILFLGTNEKEEKAAVGKLDPASGQVTWHIYSENAFEIGTRMVNTGAGIYILGGKEGLYGNPKNTMPISTIRKLNPVSMKLKDVGDEEFSFSGLSSNVTVVSDTTFYAFTGTDLISPNTFELDRITVDPAGKKGASVTTLDTEDKLFMDMDPLGSYDCVGVAAKDGIYVTGPVKTDESGRVVADTYVIDYSGKSMKALDGIVCQRPMYLMTATEYKGKYYVLGITRGTDVGYAFTAIDAETFPAVGETAYSEEWVKGQWYDKAGFRSYPYTGKWRRNSRGWWYEDTRGWYPKNQWQKIDGKWYFFDKDGYMESNAYRGGYYLTGSGAWDGKAKVTGWKKDAQGYRFILTGDSGPANQWKKINGTWYFFKKNGYMAANEFVKGYWLNKNGAMEEGTTYSWSYTHDGGWMYGNDRWYAYNASYVIDGKKYKFDFNGGCLNP